MEKFRIYLSRAIDQIALTEVMDRVPEVPAAIYEELAAIRVRLTEIVKAAQEGTVMRPPEAPAAENEVPDAPDPDDGPAREQE